MSDPDESVVDVEHDAKIDRVRSLRAQGLTPKAIAKALGTTRAEADALVRQVAREAAPTEAALVGCWVNEGWSLGLSWSGHADWREDPDGPDDGSDDEPVDGDLPDLITVLVVREHRYGRLTGCSYLVDAQCLGVKNALGPQAFERDELHAFITRQFSIHPKAPRRISLELARALVFGAEDYARGLGFTPHQDFEQCRHHLGAWQGPSAIVFGYRGKPLFIPGPNDDAIAVRATLARSVGAASAHGVGPGGDDDDARVLGTKAVPAAHRTSEAAERTERYRQALQLAEGGDASGVRELATALVEEDGELDNEDIVAGLVRLGERAIDPLLEVFQRSELEQRFAVADALVALGIRDDRILDTLVSALETDAVIAELLVDYGAPGPMAIEALERAMVRHLERLEREPDDRDMYDDAIAIAKALYELEAFSPELAERTERMLKTSKFATASLAAARPGRNEPCWCGSEKKYKKCHLESDEKQRTSGL